MGHALFFAGNELPPYSNASGSVDRRIFYIEFLHKVKGSDPYLFDKMCNNVGVWHRKAIHLYHRTIQAFGRKDIWEEGVVSDEIANLHHKLKAQVDTLMAYICDPHRFDRGDQIHTMPMKDFKDGYFTWIAENNLKRPRWTEDHYGAIFAEHEITTKEDLDEYGRREKRLVGIQKKPENLVEPI